MPQIQAQKLAAAKWGARQEGEGLEEQVSESTPPKPGPRAPMNHYLPVFPASSLAVPV